MHVNPGANSAGTQINRYLDSLGLPDSYGDKIGALVDLKRGDMAGFYRNIADLHSGLSTRTFDRLTGRRGHKAFGRCFVRRHHCRGPHLTRWSKTYVTRTRVGRQAYVGKRYDTGLRFAGIKIRGRISGRMYRGSFARPLRLGKSGYLYRGKMYKSMGAIRADLRDGRADGIATRRHRVSGWSRNPFMCRMPRWIGRFSTAGWKPANILRSIFRQPGGLFGGIPKGIPGLQYPKGGGSPSTGSVLSNPNMSLEDKLGLLMAKLSQHLDKQIEGKMKEIQNAMKPQKKKSGGGLFGKIFGAVGGLAGAAFGGPLGGMLGSRLGGALGRGAGGAGKGGKKPNLQLLQTQLQQLLQKRQQMFQTMGNILKSLHDTSMSAIRNLKA